MKTLIYIPIIHSMVDLGSIAEDVAKRAVRDLGEEIWKEHGKTIDGFWDSVVNYFDSIDVSGMKIYQDGMVAEGEVGKQIVGDISKTGSKNYMLLSNLLKRGALLAKTEDFGLVKKERDRIVEVTKALNTVTKLVAYFKYKFTKNILLQKRDMYVVKRICETLNHGETGILFMGAYHNIIPKLRREMQITEIKKVEKIKDYQKLLLCHNRNKEKFKNLSEYLISPIAN